MCGLNILKNTVICAVFIIGVVLSIPIYAHHSIGGIYDENNYLEISGVISAVHWRNPHIRFSVDVVKASGETDIWSVEMLSVSTLRRRGLSADFMSVGDAVKVWGSASRRNDTGLHAKNILLRDEDELILKSGQETRWSKNYIGAANVPAAIRKGDSSSPELGIFRVWSYAEELDGKLIWKSDYALTERAQEIQSSYDALKNLGENCHAKGMPTIMDQPYPVQFVQVGDDLEFHMEEYDTVRKITMSAMPSVEDIEASYLGSSFGRWDGGSLQVTTVAINSGQFDGDGIPLSENAILEERFTPAADGSRLDYELTITDPETFQDSVELERYWWWYPELKINPYDCEQS